MFSESNRNKSNTQRSTLFCIWEEQTLPTQGLDTSESWGILEADEWIPTSWGAQEEVERFMHAHQAWGGGQKDTQTMGHCLFGKT